jgi:hypothetical protein
MGMYATILSTEVKSSAILEKACKKVGIEPLDGMMYLHRAKVRDIIINMVETFQSGTMLSDGGLIPARNLFRLSEDAKICGLLIDWLVNSREDSIFFA